MASLAMGAVLAIGCSIGRPGDSDRVSAPAVSIDSATTARTIDLLRAGTAFIDHTSFRADVDISGGQVTTVTHADNVNKRADTTFTMSGVVAEIRMIDNDVYLRTNADWPGVGHGWMVLDSAKVPAGFAMSFAPGRNDPGGAARLFNAIVSAQVSGTDTTGTIDLTRVGTGNGISFRPGPHGNFPDSARNMKFHATLDSQHRLISFEIPTADGSPSATLHYSEFGTTVAVSRPQGTMPAPEALYPQLGLH
jgi:hypothetical protein